MSFGVTAFLVATGERPIGGDEGALD